MRKDRLDAPGAAALTAIAALLAFNQVVIVWVNEGLQPVFFAGLRSALATVFVLVWLWLRGMPLRHTPGTGRLGLLMGAIFAAEFLCLFVALDLTTVSRTGVIFYTMPVWLAIMAHVGIPGERLTPARVAGLALAFGGTALAILDRGGAGQGSLAGDLCALGAALGWAGTAYIAKGTAMRSVRPETQLLWMVAVSAPLLILAAPLFGPLVRDFQPMHLFWLLFQGGVVVAGGFIAWLWLLSVYPSATVASFSFLTPVLTMLFGWAILGEDLGPRLILAGALVAAGIVLVNRRPAPAPAPTDSRD
jgi:drug/metabolite transporter (DMT)-like permease